jgi:hypothetical protein
MSPSIAAPANGELAREVKFAVSATEITRVLAWARSNMAPVPHGSGQYWDTYRISTVCLDTPDLDVLGGRGFFARSKYRVRRYGSSSTVFLERNRIALRNLRPVWRIGYTRVARVATADGSLVRFTIDQHVNASRTRVLAFSDRQGLPIFEEQSIIELRFRHEMPRLFASFTDSFDPRWQGRSKYKLAAPALGICCRLSLRELACAAC